MHLLATLSCSEPLFRMHPALLSPTCPPLRCALQTCCSLLLRFTRRSRTPPGPSTLPDPKATTTVGACYLSLLPLSYLHPEFHFESPRWGIVVEWWEPDRLCTSLDRIEGVPDQPRQSVSRLQGARSTRNNLLAWHQPHKKQDLPPYIHGGSTTISLIGAHFRFGASCRPSAT